MGFHAEHRLRGALGRKAASGHAALGWVGPGSESRPVHLGLSDETFLPAPRPRVHRSPADPESEKSAFLIGLEYERKRVLPEARSLIGF